MNKLRLFISSVQSEFAEERQMLNDYLTTDALLGRFFEPFVFEKLPAADHKAALAYLEQVRHSDVYLGIFGKEYGFENAEGISPTEMEFDLATAEHKTRLIFITHHQSNERHPKELKLIKKAENVVVRKKCVDALELKTAVYAALVNLLEEKELIRSGPFDATICRDATFDDIDPERLRWFVRTAQGKRGFPISPGQPTKKVLVHLNLFKKDRLTNAAVLLFGRQPQRFFITSEIRCAMFHGNEVSKPIPAYQVYKGDVFQLVDFAVDFVLSRINLSVGDRSRSIDVPVNYEIPRTAIAEAIVNAVAHRDYTSNGSVQVMLFRNRLEVWNPGQLPYHLSISKLKQDHGSFPPNPLLAEPMYLAGYIERMGTGIPDMIKACVEAGLKEPVLMQDESFKVILWRKTEVTGQSGGEAAGEVSGEAAEEMRRIVLVLHNDMKRIDIQKAMQLKHDDYLRLHYLLPAIHAGLIEMTEPDNPTSPGQRYRLTVNGLELQNKLFIADQTSGFTQQVTQQVEQQVTQQVEQLLSISEGEKSRDELQELLGLKDRESFRKLYINEALALKLIEMTIPDKPNSKNQKYRLTGKGKTLQTKLKQQKEDK